MFQTLKNAWAMPELRKKILYTLFIILIFRFGSCIPVPFIDTQMLAQYFEQASTNGSMLGYLDMFSGGGLSRATIFAMSITPYINASIILQLLTVAIPALERMVKDGGEEGRKKIASWTRYVGVLLGLLQGLSYYALLRNQGFLSDKGVLAAVTIVMTFTAGTALIMWMGEHITQKGIGNGISIILFAGIVSRGPSLMRTLGNLFQTGTSGIVSAILMIIIGIFIVVFIVFMSNAERRIPVQYAKRVVGRKMYGGQSTHLPIKVNASGVMPIIFASSILALPQTVSLSYSEIAYALEKSLTKIDAALMKVLESMPPELYADIVKNGIYLAGGGALIKGLDRRLGEKTGIPFHVAEDPLRAIARGTGIALKNINRFSFLMK